MSASTAQLQQSTIRQYTLQLRLPTIGGQFLKMAEEAVKQKLAHVAYLEALLAAEVEERERNAIARRIQEAKFPKVKTLEDFHFERGPAYLRGTDPQTGRGRLSQPERTDHFHGRHRHRQVALGHRSGCRGMPSTEARAIHDGGGVSQRTD